MAKATNAFDTYTATANREELADVIIISQLRIRPY